MVLDDGRIVPDFIGIGAMKCGTTTLDRLLRSHPHIGMPRDKETDYFVVQKNFSRGEAWYTGQFDPSKPLHGEISPNYAKADVFPGVPQRIRAAAPDPALIYIVRCPVERAVSQYRHSWTLGVLDVPPAELPETPEYRHVIAVSRYADQLRRYLKHFARERVLVLDFDDLSAQPQRALEVVCRHINAVPHGRVAAERHNAAAELCRVPAPVLRFAQSPLGKRAARIVGRAWRDRARRALAIAQPRTPDPFPKSVIEQMRQDLADDARAFRAMTGMAFPRWQV